MLRTPSIKALKEISQLLRTANCAFALGGSGLLMNLGYKQSVRDWDITTDLPRPQVASVLKGYQYTLIEPTNLFGTEYLARIILQGSSFDLMGGFSIKTEIGETKFPTVVSAYWESIPLGSPEVWFVAYSLMNRKDKAQFLYDYLMKNGADIKCIKIMTAQSLAREIRAALLAFPTH